MSKGPLILLSHGILATVFVVFFPALPERYPTTLSKLASPCTCLPRWPPSGRN